MRTREASSSLVRVGVAVGCARAPWAGGDITAPVRTGRAAKRGRVAGTAGRQALWARRLPLLVASAEVSCLCTQLVSGMAGGSRIWMKIEGDASSSGKLCKV